MGRYEKLILALKGDKRSFQRAYRQLVTAPPLGGKALERHLLHNPDAYIRETCAEILRDRCKARAIPSLILALKDESQYVRDDALWAIEELAGYRTGTLFYLLDICVQDPPKKLLSTIERWWAANSEILRQSKCLW